MGVYLVALLLCSLTTYLLYRYIRCNSGNSFFDGKHVLITGGSSGIGLSLAILARRSGANITLIARNRERLKLARETLASTSTTRSDAWVEVRSMDLTSSYASLREKCDELLKALGPVDVLIHSAGFCFSREFREMPIDEIASMNHTNYLGPVHLTHILLPSMLSMFSPQQNRLSHPARERRIAFISSMGGQVAIAGLTAYSATKYAIRGFADALRMELDMTGPLVTTSFPPDTDTPGFAAENIGKPAMTLELSSTGDVANSDEVAKVLMADIAAGRRISSFGLQGASLAWLVAGIEPPICSDWLPGATIGTILECLAASPLRLIGIYQAYRMRRIVAKHQRDTTVTYGHRLNTCS